MRKELLLMSLIFFLIFNDLNSQTPTDLKVFRSECSNNEEWIGWQAITRPYFRYNFSLPFTRAEVIVSNEPYGGSYNKHYTFDNGNKCNQWFENLPTGRYTWRVSVYYQKSPDPYRWSEYATGPDFYVDIDPPSPPAVTESHCGGSASGWPAWTAHNSPYFTWSQPSDNGSGVSYYQVSVNGGGWNTVSSGWHPTYEGKNYFDFRSVDGVGNTSSIYRIYVRSDNTPPPPPDVIETDCGIPGVWTKHTSPHFIWTIVFDEGEMTGNGSGLNHYEVSVNGGAWTTVSPGWHPTYGTGQYTFSFRSVDNVGNASTPCVKSGIYIDDTPPQKPIVTEEHCGGTTGENPPWTTHTSPYFSFSLPSDEGSGVPPNGCQVSVNSGEWKTVFSGWHPELVRGSYTFDFRAIDNVGHISETYRLYVTIRQGYIIYVSKEATGKNNGMSWTNAFTDLQSALSSAMPGDTIWVAKGTYKPSVDKNGDSNPSDPRTKAFCMVSDIPVFGGFAGNEASLAQRNIKLNETILSGDIGETGINDDNCYSVIRGASNTLLDGFTITAGNGNGTVSLETDMGGGLYNNGISNVKIRNCIFINNFSKQGGAIGNYFCFDSIIVSNCRFINNSSYNGGAIGNWDIRTFITNSIFTGNTTSSSNSYGSAIYNWGSGSTSVITNCTFYNNIDESSRGAIHNRGVTSTVVNSILWGNGQDIVNSNPMSGCNVFYSCVEQPGYAGNNGNISSNPMFIDASNGDFRLSGGSPCIDAADGTKAPAFDIDGNARSDDPETPNTGNGSPDYSDMGTFEYLFTTGFVLPANESSINIFPNPGNGSFRIESNIEGTVEIYSITGKPLLRRNFTPGETIKINQPAGIYVLRIKTPGKTETKKLIIR